MSYKCECYVIGGPWIAEDPNCPVHGAGGLNEQVEEVRDEVEQLTKENERLRKLLADVRDKSKLVEVDGKPAVIVDYAAWKACCA